MGPGVAVALGLIALAFLHRPRSGFIRDAEHRRAVKARRFGLAWTGLGLLVSISLTFVPAHSDQLLFGAIMVTLLVPMAIMVVVPGAVGGD
jgi:hypothetical protein